MDITHIVICLGVKEKDLKVGGIFCENNLILSIKVFGKRVVCKALRASGVDAEG